MSLITAERAAAAPARRRLQAVGSRDAAMLSVGTVASGVLAYAFNVVAARTLGPEGYGPIAALWAMLFLLAVLLFRPLEQTMSRAVADRIARGQDANLPVRSISALGGAIAVAAATACLLAWQPLTDRVFDGNGVLTASLAAGLVGYGVSYLARGVLGGVQWFGGYGQLLLWDGLVRVALGLLLLVSATPAVAGAALVGAAFAGPIAPMLSRERRRLRRLDGAPSEAYELRTAARFAAPAAVVALCEQVLICGGPLLVLLAGGEGASTAAGIVFAAMLLVRAPVFLFQGVAAKLLPSLTTFEARGDHARMQRATLTVAGVIVAFATVSVAGALLAGPQAMALLYGDGFDATSGDLALLAAGVGAFLGASTFSQAVFAKGRAGGAALAWAAGAGVFAALELSLTGPAMHRVALAFAIGSGVVAISMFACAWRARM